MARPFGYIYKTTNKINGKHYIGKHKYQNRDIDPNYFGSGKILRQAISKYGLENFTCEILLWCFSEEELNMQEKYFINKLKRNSYNIAAGGDGGYLIKFLSYEQRREIYNKMIKTRKERNVGRGENNPMYKSGERGIHPLLGKNHKEETKMKISNSLKGQVPWNKGMKAVTKEKDPIKSYLENKCKIPLKIIKKDDSIEFFESRNSFREKYPSINVKYGLKKKFYKDMIFESITKEEYLKEVMS